MSEPESQKMPKPDDIEARLNFFEESNRWTLEALGMVSSLSDFHATLSGRESRQSPEEILAETRVRLKRLFTSEAMAFFLINEEDFDFVLTDCEPEEDREKLQMRQIALSRTTRFHGPFINPDP